MAVPELAIERFLFPRLSITRFHSDSAYRSEIFELVRHGVGGFVCFDGSIAECGDAIRAIRGSGEHPLLFAADCEFGTAMRFAGGTAFPPMMGLAQGGEKIVEDAALGIAREMNAIGLDWNLAPVLDINTNRDNPIINVRSFGDDPEIVSLYGSAFVRGLSRGGVLSCGKHLPGHGDTSIDSHIGLPTLEHSLERLRETELKPFVAAVAAGVDSLMSAHLLAPALGAVQNPVSLSTTGVTKIRSLLGFDGVLITDALDMGALYVSEESDGDMVATRAFIAGNDILELPFDPLASLDALRKGRADGTISPARLEESSRRVQSLYSRRALLRESVEIQNDLDSLMRENQILATRASRLAIRRSGEPIPDPEQTGSWHIYCGPMDAENCAAIVTKLSTIPDCKAVDVSGTLSGTIREGRGDLSPILILCYSPRGGAGTIGIGREQLEKLRIPLGLMPWVITLGNPYLPELLQARGKVDLFSATPPSIDMLAEIVTGRYRPNASGLS